MKNFIFELKISWRGIYGNLLEWIPVIFVFIKSSAPSIHLKWIGLELSLWIGLLKTPGKVFYLTPNIIFKHLDKKYKEKYDFQFYWLGISYRKFIGERINYEVVLAEESKNTIKWDEISLNNLNF